MFFQRQISMCVRRYELSKETMFWQATSLYAMMVLCIEATNKKRGSHGMNFSDHFSDHAGRYEAYRPRYPAALFSYLASLVAKHNLAWDCATGNGQAALGLAPHFRCIVALDASSRQLALAPTHKQIIYLVALADQTPLPDRSVDLVTVASAFHWLDFPRFYAEVRRVAKPDGVLASWGYKWPNVTPEVDAVVQRFAADVLRGFWLPETRLAVEAYQTIPFPFDEIITPLFQMTEEWSQNQLMGFLGTWSASLRYSTQTGRDPIDEIRGELEGAWGDSHEVRQVSWDLFMRVGRISG